MPQRYNRIQILITFVVLGTASLATYSWNTPHDPNQKRNGTEITKNMKTVCLGRYLIDIPALAEFSIGAAEMDSIKIEYVGTSPSELSFKEKVNKREAELRAAKHETEGTRLRSSLDISEGKQKLLVFREDYSDIYITWVETSVRSGKDEWKISNDASEEYVDKTKILVTELASKIISRPQDIVPQGSGACVQNGFITGKSFEREDFPAGIRLESQNLTLSVHSETSGPREPGETLWDRIGRADSLGKEVFGKSTITDKTLRHAKVSVDGRKGQEHVTLFRDKGMEFFNADAEIYGNATPKLPTFQISMETSRPIKPDSKSTKKALSNEEALALWDAVLKSIRPRPGAF